MKTILVPTENNDAMPAILETALALARRCDGYIEGFALRWAIGEVVAFDAVAGTLLEEHRRESAGETSQARRLFKSFMQEHGVPPANGTSATLSFGWLDEAPEGTGFVGRYGRVFDVIVMGIINSAAFHTRAIESGLFESGRPVLLSPPSPPPQIATNVLIAWNRSAGQALTVALAMPLLKKADRVTVVTVNGGTETTGPSADQLVRYLQLNGTRAEPLTVELDGRKSGEEILETAKSLHCDLLVKGAYTQSRLRQMIFGGATEHILANASLPIFLAG